MRRVVTIVLVVVGIVLLVVGYLTAAPWGAGSVADSDPRLLGAPMLFILGIVVMLSAALFYELFPDSRR